MPNSDDLHIDGVSLIFLHRLFPDLCSVVIWDEDPGRGTPFGNETKFSARTNLLGASESGFARCFLESCYGHHRIVGDQMAFSFFFFIQCCGILLGGGCLERKGIVYSVVVWLCGSCTVLDGLGGL